ncbi:MAG: Hint domain-containing protein [Paracoccaceae bacterium]
MPQGYLVTLGDNFLGAGDDVGGVLTTFTTVLTLGPGSWVYTGERIHNDHTHSEVNEPDTGNYYFATDGNVYFVPDNDFIASGSGTVTDAPDFENDEIVTGTFSDDIIDAAYTGDPDWDFVDGIDGDDDVIDALDGHDSISAGDGADTIYGGEGRDTVHGGSGNDEIYGDRSIEADYSATQITIDNFSFEATSHGEDDFSEGIPDWTVIGSDTGDWNPTSSSMDVSTVTGDNVAYLYDDGDIIRQSVSDVYDSENTYVFFFDIGDSYEGNSNYTVNIRAGTTVIGTITRDTGDEDRLDGDSVSSEGFSDPAFDGQTISIEFVKNSGGLLNLDNVRGEVRTPVDPDTGIGGRDQIFGEDGDDTIDGGKGNDTVDGGADDDTIIMSSDSDSIDGGSGSDTYDASNGIGGTGETINVTVSGEGATSGAGTIAKTGDGSTDTLENIETVIAGEDAAEADSIVVNGLIDYMQISGLDDNAVGIFTPSWGSSGPIAFGGSGQPTLGEILSFSYDPGTGPVHPVGTFEITSGDESGTVGDITFQNFENIEFSTVCFAPGTLIDTPAGLRKIEDLTAGDFVITAEGTQTQIRWNHASDTPIDGQDDDYPILIKAGALGRGMPENDLIVSPQHRILVGEHGQLEDCFDTPALVAAKALAGLNGIRQMRGKSDMMWWHFACDTHEVIRANGALAETLLIGEMVLNGLPWSHRIKVHKLFGIIGPDRDTLNGPPARPLLSIQAAQDQIETARLGVRLQIGWHAQNGTRNRATRHFAHG